MTRILDDTAPAFLSKWPEPEPFDPVANLTDDELRARNLSLERRGLLVQWHRFPYAALMV